MTLIDQFIPKFQTIKNFAAMLGEEYDKTFVELEQEMDDMLALDENTEYSSKRNADALFAVCALIDELILDSQWEHKDQWAASPLQKKYFDTNNAGTEFYQRLDQLNENDRKDQDVREIYLYALVQGFSGRYFEAGEQSLRQEIIRANHNLLSTDLTSALFSPQIPESSKNSVKQVNRKRQKEWAATVGPIMVVLLAYLLLRNDVLNSISEVLSQL